MGSTKKLIEIEEGDKFSLFFCFLAGLQEGVTVMERKTNELLAAGDNFTITQAAGFSQRKFIILRMLYQMHDLFEFHTGFTGCFSRLWGRITVKRLESARITPLIAAEFVPVAPEVIIRFPPRARA